MRGNVYNKWQRSGGGGLIVGGLRNSFVSVHGSNIVVSERHVGSNMVGL